MTFGIYLKFQYVGNFTFNVCTCLDYPSKNRFPKSAGRVLLQLHMISFNRKYLNILSKKIVPQIHRKDDFPKSMSGFPRTAFLNLE